MDFRQALEKMKQGKYVKLPIWGGFWSLEWDNILEQDTIIIHCADGEILDIRDTDMIDVTLGYVASDEWIVATHENCPLLLASAQECNLFSFGKAIEALKRGERVARKGWNGKGIFLELQKPDANSKMSHPYIYIDTTGLITSNGDAPKNRVPWVASQTDMLAEDYYIMEGAWDSSLDGIIKYNPIWDDLEYKIQEVKEGGLFRGADL